MNRLLLEAGQLSQFHGPGEVGGDPRIMRIRLAGYKDWLTNSRARPVFGIALFAGNVLADQGHGMTWLVKGNAQNVNGTIQASIDTAADGDTILVDPGTYFENIDFHGKNICLKSASGATETVLDGSTRAAPVITCRSGESNRTTIQGFTITGGRGHVEFNNSSLGGGVLCMHSQPRIIENIVVGNRAETPTFGAAWGGGLLIFGSVDDEPVIIQDNIISDNYAGNGGGAWIEAPCLFSRNVLEGNSTGGDGAGLYVINHAVDIIDNQFIANRAGDHGGGAYLTNAFPNLVGNIFISNESNTTVATDCSGAALWVFGLATIRNNTFAFNKATAPSEPAAGGLCVVRADAGSIFEQNIVYMNTGGGVIGSSSSFGQSSLTLSRNLIYANSPLDVSSSSEVLIEEIDDLHVDPLFCTEGAGSDGTVSSSSPALNQSYGIIGAKSDPGCGPVAVKKVTWGFLKAKY